MCILRLFVAFVLFTTCGTAPPPPRMRWLARCGPSPWGHLRTALLLVVIATCSCQEDQPTRVGIGSTRTAVLVPSVGAPQPTSSAPGIPEGRSVEGSGLLGEYERCMGQANSPLEVQRCRSDAPPEVDRIIEQARCAFEGCDSLLAPEPAVSAKWRKLLDTP